MKFAYLTPNKQSRLGKKNTEQHWLGGKANLTGNNLPVSTALTVVKRPLWVLTGSVTGAVVCTGATVVTTSGTMVVLRSTTVVAGRVGCTIGSSGGGKVGTSSTGLAGTVGSGFFGHGPFHL